jgi:hypothetical protein
MFDPSKEIQPELPEWCKKIVCMLNAGRILKPRYIEVMKRKYDVTDEQIAEFIDLYLQALEAAKEAMLIHTAVVNPNEPIVELVDDES